MLRSFSVLVELTAKAVLGVVVAAMLIYVTTPLWLPILLVTVGAWR